MCPMKAPFTEMFMDANQLDREGFKSWVFCEQMLFNAPGKWWGDLGRRDFPHEGIDFCLYFNCSGQVCRLDHHTHIPVMHDGVVRAVFKDYLGRAIILEHESGEGRYDPCLSAYAHTVPLEGIEPGAVVRRGDIIARIADTSTSKARIHPHLHYSFGRPSSDLAYDDFVWNIIRDPRLVTLLDPMEILDGPFQVLDDSTDPPCPYP